jgi:hypothetical protein
MDFGAGVVKTEGAERQRSWMTGGSGALDPRGPASIVDIAAQMGHDATTTLSTYAHVVAELRDAPRIGADAQIRAARSALLRNSYGPNTAHEPIPGQLTIFDSPSEPQKAPQMRDLCEEPTGGLEPPTPSLRVMCSTS